MTGELGACTGQSTQTQIQGNRRGGWADQKPAKPSLSNLDPQTAGSASS